MPKFFIFLFIAFFTITGSIILFSKDDKKEPTKNKFQEIDYSKELNKLSYTSDNVKREIKEKKEVLKKEKLKKVKKVSKNIDDVIAKADALIENYDLKVPDDLESKKINKDKIEKLKKKIKRIKEKLDNISASE